MYGFPKIDDIKPLIGQNLIQICCNANQVVFEFSEKAKITCEKEFKLIKKSGKMVDVGIPLNMVELMSLIESTVEAVVGNGEKCLILKFANGDKISFCDDDHYEAYKMNIGQKEFLV